MAKSLLSFLKYKVPDKRHSFTLTKSEKSVPYTPPETTFKELDLNRKTISDAFLATKNTDIIIRNFVTNWGKNAFLVQIDGMSDSDLTTWGILTPLTEQISLSAKPDPKSIIRIAQLKTATGFKEIIDSVLMGDTAVFFDGDNTAYLCETKNYPNRGVEQPQNEGSIKGSHEAFNESVRVNISLVRKILKTPRCVNEFLRVGNNTNLSCGILYIDGIANPQIVEEIKYRLNNIKGDFIYGSGLIEQLIEDSPFSLFPTVLTTERPDLTAVHISNGSVAIMCDSSPYSIIVPVTVADAFHITEDTAMRWQYSTLMRFIRTIALFASAYLPALYVAAVNFHKELIPTDLMISIATATATLPMPLLLEMLFVEISFELIREASTRVPGLLGSTVGIVGGLILGSAAVEANLVSPPLIIIIALTALGNFSIPDYSVSVALRIVRIALILAASFFGMFGIGLLSIAILSHIVNCKSFGVDVFAPKAPDTYGSIGLSYKKPVYKYELRKDYLNSQKPENQPETARKWDYPDTK